LLLDLAKEFKGFFLIRDIKDYMGLIDEKILCISTRYVSMFYVLGDLLS